MTEPKPQLQPCIQALLDCAQTGRPDIDRGDLESALIACHEAGWDWPRTFIAAAVMLAKGGQPYELRDACRDPLKRHRPYVREVQP